MSSTDHTTDEFVPVRVHIAGSDLQQDIALQRPKRLAISPRTVVLTAAAPFQFLCGQEPYRAMVKILVTDNPVVLCDSQGQANQPGNLAAGLTNPEGAYLPVATTFYDIPSTDQLWVVAAAYPTRVTIVGVSYAED